MRKCIFGVACILFAGIFFACQPKSGSKINAEVYSRFQNAGNEISNTTQGVLLANVGKAIQNGGPVNAVSFCNLNASGIVDSLNRIYNCKISRVSAKNRNPQNALQSETDKEIWNYFSARTTKSFPRDTLIAFQGEMVYYKPIKTGMETCLKCHGIPNQDIDTETYELLQKLYPNDLATGYRLNDFRGLWKIRFQKTKTAD